MLASSGEDAIVFSTSGDYAANIEKAEAVAPAGERPAPPGEELKEVHTPPGQRTIDAVSQFLGMPAERSVKTLLVKAEADENGESGLVA